MADKKRSYLECVDDRTYIDCVDDRTYIDCVDDRTYVDCVDDTDSVIPSPTPVTPPAPPAPYRNDDIWYKELFYKLIVFINKLFAFFKK